MQKRYQVFISSTRVDLEDERRTLTNALLKNQYIPVGMEHFPASPNQAWPLIKRFIDECDFYVLVIGGTYGSINPESGLSYTESEYRYATQAGKPILAFVHGDIDSIPAAKVERTGARRRKLAEFTARVEAELTRATWHDAHDLAHEVTSALYREVQQGSAVGWVRADSIPEQFGLLHDDLLGPCARLGIRRVSVDGVAGPDLPENLERARVIRVMSTSAVRLLEIYKQSFIAAFRNGGRIQVLLPVPQGTFVTDVEESESAHVRRRVKISEEIDTVRSHLIDILGDADTLSPHRPPDVRGAVEIGYFTTHLRSTLVLCDDRWGWLTLTLPPARAPETASLVLDAADRSLLSVCVRHFDRTWDVVASRGTTELLTL